MDTHKSWCTPMQRGRKLKLWEKHLSAVLTDPTTGLRKEKVAFPVSNYLIPSPPSAHAAATDPPCIQEYLGNLYSVNQVKSRLDAQKSRIFWIILRGSMHKSSLKLCRTDRQGTLTFPLQLQLLLPGSFIMCLIVLLTEFS